MSRNFFIFALLFSATVGCIPTVSPDEDDIMAQLEEMRTTMAMLETTATCGVECQPTTTSVTSTTTSTTTTTTTTCLGGGELFENSCYLVINDYYTNPEATTECNARVPGATLCVITSLPENEFISMMHIDCSMNCRIVIGGMRDSVSDPYIWDDGVSFADTWTNWLVPGNPSANPLHLCVHIDRNMASANRWQSRRCDEEGYACCEYPPTPIG